MEFDIAAYELKFYEFIDTLPIDIGLYHPYVIHFAIVLPIFALLFQLLALTAPSKGYQNGANFLFMFSILFILAAFLTGKAVGPYVKPTLSIEGQNLFDVHKNTATYVMMLYIGLLFFKLLSMMIKKPAIRLLLSLLLITGVAGIVYTAKTGHELVYLYSAGTDKF